MDRSEIKTEMNNYKNYENAAPFQSQVDSSGAFPNPNTLMFNIDPTCLLFNPFWPQMPFPVPSPFGDGTTSAAGTAATVAPTEGDAAANAEEGKKPKRRRKRKRRRRRRRRNRRRKTKVVVQYVGVPMIPQIPGQFPMPMPFMPTPSGVLTQALFTEEAKATLAMHEDQPSTSEVFPEIKKLREQHIADLKREVSDSLTEYRPGGRWCNLQPRAFGATLSLPKPLVALPFGRLPSVRLRIGGVRGARALEPKRAFEEIRRVWSRASGSHAEIRFRWIPLRHS